MLNFKGLDNQSQISVWLSNYLIINPKNPIIKSINTQKIVWYHSLCWRGFAHIQRMGLSPFFNGSSPKPSSAQRRLWPPVFHSRYRGIVGSLGYLVNITRTDLAFKFAYSEESELIKYVQFPGKLPADLILCIPGFSLCSMTVQSAGSLIGRIPFPFQLGRLNTWPLARAEKRSCTSGNRYQRNLQVRNWDTSTQGWHQWFCELHQTHPVVWLSYLGGWLSYQHWDPDQHLLWRRS